MGMVQLSEGRTLMVTSKDAWAALVEKAIRNEVLSAWDAADLIVFGIDTFTDGSRGQVADLKQELAEQLERSVETIRNYERIARRFPPDKRYYSPSGLPLSLAHHDVVYSLSDSEAHSWLQEAWANGWTVARFRVEVSAGSKEPEPITLPNPVAIERAFYRAGIRMRAGPRRCTFETPAGTLVLTSESEMVWSCAS